ncbi:multidrug resistance protein Y [Escherichia coli]|nr:multidrug resistance protein Y [Escherichia coli]
MMNPVPWLQMTNMISYQGLVRTFPRRESLHHSQLTATIDQFNPVFNSSSQIMDKYYGSLSGVLNEINNEITQQSLSISANEIFRMAAIAFILLTVLVWFAKPPFTAKGVG